MRFMAMARVSWASLLMEPKDIAPVAKRLTMALAGSTSSSGTGFFADFSAIKPRNVHKSRFCLSIRSLYSWNVWKLLVRTACCILLTVDGLSR